MRRVLRANAVPICLLISASTAHADSKAKEERETRKLVHDYARCVVRKNADLASDAIRANADNGTIMRKYPALIDGGCMATTGGSIEARFGGDLYRYAIADALVNARYKTVGEISFANRLPLAHLPLPDRAAFDTKLAVIKSKSKRQEMEEGFKKQYSVGWLSRYGECIVRHDPVKTRLWLLTPPDGPEETSRINDLRAAFADCLQAGTLRFNRTVMRGTVAINYFRLATATPIVGLAQ